ncbi:MAG: DUF2059 domain-containing protein [Alphaproteobacteria bacterium]|nr:DUF2059 domain-containing protein [Alphaproteobacteria bacterium]
MALAAARTGLIASLLVASLLAATSAARAADDQTEKILLAQKIFDMTNVVERTKSRAERYAKAAFEENKASLKPLDATTQEDLIRQLADAVAQDEIAIRPAEIKVYADAFTTQELKDIIAFYSSGLGQKLVKKAPDIERESAKVFYAAMSGKFRQHWKDLTAKYRLTVEKL